MTLPSRASGMNQVLISSVKILNWAIRNSKIWSAVETEEWCCHVFWTIRREGSLTEPHSRTAVPLHLTTRCHDIQPLHRPPNRGLEMPPGSSFPNTICSYFRASCPESGPAGQGPLKRFCPVSADSQVLGFADDRFVIFVSKSEPRTFSRPRGHYGLYNRPNRYFASYSGTKENIGLVC